LAGCERRGQGVIGESIEPDAPRRWADEAQILTAPSKTGVKLDDVALVDDLRNISQVAAGRYLEYVVVAKKSPAKELHEDLLGRLLDEAEEEVKDDGVKYHLEELGACRRRGGPLAASSWCNIACRRNVLGLIW
jgi:hypothetical protein